MAEAWGAIERAIGTVLSTINDVIPSWGVAIILLTVLVRIVLIPLTVKQIRSMSAMQKIQPELKRLQTKYKGDRQKMNEELMKLYREHGVNPLGGCFPLLMQAPVFIALYSVLRATILFDAGLATPLPPTFSLDKTTVCRPEGTPAPEGPGKTTVICRKDDQSQSFQVVLVKQQRLPNPPELDALPPYVSTCAPRLDTTKEPDELIGFTCQSPGGSGHLPKDGELFADIVRDKSTFLGMHLACSPQQSLNKTSLAQCTASETETGAAVAGYYALVALMVGTTYYQQRQMTRQATGPQAKQMQMMGRIMPVFLGFISLSIPAGVIIYWVVSNVWTIGQQRFFLKRQTLAPEATPPAPAGGSKGKPDRPNPAKPKPAKPKPAKPKPKR